MSVHHQNYNIQDPGIRLSDSDTVRGAAPTTSGFTSTSEEELRELKRQNEKLEKQKGSKKNKLNRTRKNSGQVAEKTRFGIGQNLCTTQEPITEQLHIIQTAQDILDLTLYQMIMETRDIGPSLMAEISLDKQKLSSGSVYITKQRRVLRCKERTPGNK